MCEIQKTIVFKSKKNNGSYYTIVKENGNDAIYTCYLFNNVERNFIRAKNGSEYTLCYLERCKAKKTGNVYYREIEVITAPKQV